MGCRPIQYKVINHAPIGFNSRSRAGFDPRWIGVLSALTVAVCPESSAKSQSTKHLRPNGDGRQKQAKRNQRGNLSDDNANHSCLPRTKEERSSLIVLV
jgi:hypothetical protein